MDDNTKEIERYLQGKLSLNEEKSFNKRYREDREFRRLVQAAKNRIDDVDVQGTAHDVTSGTSSRTQSPWVWRVLVVVSFAIAIGVIVLKNVKYDEPVLPADEENVSRQKVSGSFVDIGQGVVVDLDQMYRNVEAGEDLVSTIDSLKLVLTSIRSNKVLANIEIKLYLAKAYVKLNDYASAMPLLKEVIASGDTKLTGEAQLLYYKIQGKV